MIFGDRGVRDCQPRFHYINQSIFWLSVCLSVRPGRACIVIIRCTLARIKIYDWIVQCSGHPDTTACPPTLSCLFFQFHLEDRSGMDKCKLRENVNTDNDK